LGNPLSTLAKGLPLGSGLGLLDSRIGVDGVLDADGDETLPPEKDRSSLGVTALMINGVVVFGFSANMLMEVSLSALKTSARLMLSSSFSSFRRSISFFFSLSFVLLLSLPLSCFSFFSFSSFRSDFFSFSSFRSDFLSFSLSLSRSLVPDLSLSLWLLLWCLCRCLSLSLSLLEWW